MKVLFLDYETFYDDEYSLRKMTPPQYIADPRFEVLNCAFIHLGQPPIVVEGPEVARYVETEVDWEDTFAVSHNALFDMLILSMRYGKIAKKYGDTLAMARNWISHSTGRVSLEACAKYYGLPPKWQTVQKTKGVNYRMLQANPLLHREVNDYAIDDTEKCQFIFNRMISEGFPVSELDVIDMVVRMAAVPQFEVDLSVASAHLNAVLAHKQELLDRAGMDNRDNLMRDEALAAMLILLEPNIDLPKKISKKTGLENWAFAKTDKGFTDLLDHDNPDVQALVAARLGHKTTIEETRTQRFIDIGRATPRFPIPLKYSGAHTHRFSGDWSINAQNLPRGGELRRALKAPKGKKVVAVDASQIEARFNAMLSGEQELLDQFARGEDVYANFAEKIYKHPVNAIDNKQERFVGKTGILSLGYSSSALVFMNMLRNQGGVELPIHDCAQVVATYRMTYRKIVENWNHASKVILPVMAGTLNMYPKHMWGPLEIQRNKIILPNGNALRYRDLSYQHDEERGGFSWIFYRGPRPIYTYGAKIVENVIQALAFVHIMEVAARVQKLTAGLLPLAHQVHDELIYVVDEGIAEMVGALVKKEMATPPAWFPDVPLGASVGIGDNYLETK